MKPDITKENIEKFYALNDELEELHVNLNNVDAGVKAFKENVVSLTRKDGTVVELTEDVLWTEIYQLKTHTEAYAFMKQKYPALFDAADAYEAKAAEITRFGLQAFGMDPTRLRLSDIIRIMEALLDYKLSDLSAKQAA